MNQKILDYSKYYNKIIINIEQNQFVFYKKEEKIKRNIIGLFHRWSDLLLRDLYFIR